MIPLIPATVVVSPAPATAAPSVAAPIVIGAPRSAPVQELRWTGETLPIASGTHLLFPVWGGTFGGTLGTASSVTPRYRLYVAGVDRTEDWSIVAGTSINQQIGAAATATVALDFTSGGTRPDPWDEIIIIESETGRRLFGGEVTNIEESNPDGTQRVRLRLNCVGYAGRLERRKIGAYYEAGGIMWTPASMVNDLLLKIPETGVRYGGGDGGEAFNTEVIIQHSTAAQAIKQVLDPWGLDYFVDAHGRLFIIDPTLGAGAAPFSVAQANGTIESDTMTVKRDRAKLITRVSVRADLREPSMWTDTFTSDASGIGFYVTSYRLTEKPVVLENGTPKIVAESGTNATAYDYLYLPDGYGVTRSAGTGGSAEIRVMYPSKLQPVYTLADDAAESLYGIHEAIIDVRDVYDRDRLAEIAQGELDRRNGETYVVTYGTHSSDYLRPGMLQAISHTLPYVPAGNFIIDSVNGTHQPALNEFFRWQVTATNRAIQGSGNAVRREQRLAAALQQPQDRHRQVYGWDLAKSIDGQTNDGVALTGNDGDTLPRGEHRITRPGFLSQVRLRFATAPANEVAVDVFLARGVAAPVSIFANSQYITFRAADAGGQVVSRDFSTQPYAVQDGDILTAQVMTADSTAKDGILEVEQQG